MNVGVWSNQPTECRVWSSQRTKQTYAQLRPISAACRNASRMERDTSAAPPIAEPMVALLSAGLECVRGTKKAPARRRESYLCPDTVATCFPLSYTKGVHLTPQVNPRLSCTAFLELIVHPVKGAPWKTIVRRSVVKPTHHKCRVWSNQRTEQTCAL